MRPELAFASITELAAALRGGDVTSTELVQGFIERIRATDSRLRSFITVAEEQALAAAAAADAALHEGHATSLLTGIPLAVKDNINVAGMPLTNNSRVMAHYVPSNDAPPVRNLRAAGAVILGKTDAVQRLEPALRRRWCQHRLRRGGGGRPVYRRYRHRRRRFDAAAGRAE